MKKPAGDTAPPELVAEGLSVQDRIRTLTVVGEPAGGSAPIVLLLHGSNQNAARFRSSAGNAFDRLAGSDEAVVAYLDGHKGHWNDARISNTFAARIEGFDDVAFVREAIDLLARRYGGDRSRVYVAGFSNGGQMVLRLVHELPDLLAGAVVVSATQPVPENFAPARSADRPVPMLFVHGTRDPLVPYDGGMASMWGFRPRGLGLSAPRTAAYYARRNGITTEPVTEHVTVSGGRDMMSVDSTEYRQDGREPVVLYTVHGGGHVVPGTKRAPFVLGRTAMNFDTVRAIDGFFALAGS
jgi:polyhydroxybutyrate depolymerase